MCLATVYKESDDSVIFKNKTYLHSLSFPASAARYSKTVIYTVKKQIINTCSPKKHSHKYSAQYSHTAV